MEAVGMKIFTRGGPFLIGLIIGFIFNQKFSASKKPTFASLGKMSSTALWALILLVILAAVNMPYSWNKGIYNFSPCVC